MNETNRFSRRVFIRQLTGKHVGEKGAQRALEALREYGVTWTPVQEDADELYVRCRAATTFGDEEMRLLCPLKERITWLDLAGTEVSAEGMAVVAEMTHLERLYLQNTTVDDAALEHVKELTDLTYLNLYGTCITDTGLVYLHGLEQLRHLFLWQTDVSEAGVQQLRRHLPGLTASTGVAL